MNFDEMQNDSHELDSKYLTFWTDDQLFGISIASVVQIVGIQEITEIPEYPMYAKGIINLRGTIIPVIDMRLRLGKMETEYNDRTCIIVVSIRGTEIGFIVDSVDEVTDVDPEQVTAPPRVGQGYAGNYLTGIGKMDDRVVLLLDIEKILSEDTFELLMDAT